MFAPHVSKPQTKAAADSTTTSRISTRGSWSDGAVEQTLLPQQSIGNQTRLRFLAHKSLSPHGNERGVNNEQAFDHKSVTFQKTPRGLTFDFSKISIDPLSRANRPQAQSSLREPWLPGAVQAKLVVGEVNDPLEHEAHHVADQVMCMGEPELSVTPAPALLSRKCATCEEAGKAKMLQTEPPVSTEAAAAAAPPIVHEVLREPGEPLDPATRTFFEPRFGRDFSQVRIHTDGKAAESARAINALAFTRGSDIIFAQGRYEPNSASGRHLLAHELAHTVQRGSRSTVRRVIKSDSPLGNYFRVWGIPSVTTAGNVYSANLRGTKQTAQQEVLVDMLASPREFYINGADTQQTEQSLSDHVAARLGIVTFALQKKYSFASVSGFKMNPLYYDLFPEEKRWRRKPGVDPQAAWEDLNRNPQLYAIGCAAATQLTQSGGSKGAKIRDERGGDENDWIAGDSGYVKNKKFPRGAAVTRGQEPDIGLLGENIIYLGSGQFWGHFSGDVVYRTLPEWKALVAKWHGGGAPGASEVDSNRGSPMTGLR